MKHAFNARTKRLIWQSSKVWFPALKAFSWFWLLDPSKSGGIKNHVGDLIWQDHVLSHKLGSKIGQIPWKTKLFGKNYKTTILFTNSWIQIYENESLTVTSLWSQEIPESHSHDRKYNFQWLFFVERNKTTKYQQMFNYVKRTSVQVTEKKSQSE